MKASLNGVSQLSILDGWWIEGYNGKNGWAFGKKKAEEGYRGDAEALYDILEKEVVPLYYKVDDEGIPSGWVKVMKEAIKSTAPAFSARRMTKEYAMKYYQKALKSASDFHLSKKLV
jgi:starch phosphorylase